MRGLLRKLLVMIVLLAVTGGQWMVLQSAAWAGMLVSHLRSESVVSAVSNTFDGNHPCPLCTAIERGKKNEKKPDADPDINRIEFLPRCCETAMTQNNQLRSTFSLLNEFADSIAHQPDIRPPIEG